MHGKKLVASVKTEKQNLRSALTNKAVGDKFQRVPDEESEEHLQSISFNLYFLVIIFLENAI